VFGKKIFGCLLYIPLIYLMEQVISIRISIEELKKLVKDALKESLTEYFTGTKRDASNEYLTRNQVATLLKVTLPTLNRWAKTGVLKCHRVGRRVFYKMSDIELSLKKIEV
jgi:excisionase family DNA binding protein